MVSNFLGPYTINNGVKKRWYQKVYIGNEDMNLGGHTVAKTVSEEGKDSCGVENENDADWEPQVPRALRLASRDGRQKTARRIRT